MDGLRLRKVTIEPFTPAELAEVGSRFNAREEVTGNGKVLEVRLGDLVVITYAGFVDEMKRAEESPYCSKYVTASSNLSVRSSRMGWPLVVETHPKQREITGIDGVMLRPNHSKDFKTEDDGESWLLYIGSRLIEYFGGGSTFQWLPEWDEDNPRALWAKSLLRPPEPHRLKAAARNNAPGKANIASLRDKAARP